MITSSASDDLSNLVPQTSESAMKASIRLLPPFLCSALLSGLLAALFAHVCRAGAPGGAAPGESDNVVFTSAATDAGDSGMTGEPWTMKETRFSSFSQSAPERDKTLIEQEAP